MDCLYSSVRSVRFLLTKRLIHDIHRRSLWQVLEVYLGDAWVALQRVGL
jgi:hypothetical protein